MCFCWFFWLGFGLWWVLPSAVGVAFAEQGFVVVWYGDEVVCLYLAGEGTDGDADVVAIYLCVVVCHGFIVLSFPLIKFDELPFDGSVALDLVV